MNQLRSWLYGHRVYVLDKQPPGADLSVQTSSLEGDIPAQERTGLLENTSQSEIRQSASQPESRQSALLSAILKVIPLAPGDCLECKLVGSSVMMFSGVLVLTSAVAARKRNPKLAGLNGTVYLLLCSSLFVGLQAAAFCRLFDVGPFDKHAGISVTPGKKP